MRRVEFLKVLELVKPGLASSEFLDQSTSFVFFGDKIVTYNDSIGISCRVKGLGLEGAVRAEELYKLLSRSDSENVELFTRDGQLIVRSGKSEAGMLFDGKVSLPVDHLLSRKRWVSVDDSFVECLRFVMFSCCNNMSEPILTCVHVRRDGWIESTDNFRITRINLGSELVIDSDLLIPVVAVKEVVKYGEVKRIACSDGWLHFRFPKGVVFSCRIFFNQFPKVSDYMDVEGQDVTFPEGLDRVIDRAMVFSKSDTKLGEEIEISIDSEGFIVESRSDVGWFRERIDCNTGVRSSVCFKVNPYFMKDMLARSRDCLIGQDRMRFSGEDWEHVVCLSSS